MQDWIFLTSLTLVPTANGILTQAFSTGTLGLLGSHGTVLRGTRAEAFTNSSAVKWQILSLTILIIRQLKGATKHEGWEPLV